MGWESLTVSKEDIVVGSVFGGLGGLQRSLGGVEKEWGYGHWRRAVASVRPSLVFERMTKLCWMTKCYRGMKNILSF